MTVKREQHELISALMDSEIGDFKLQRTMDVMLADGSLCSMWGRFHLIGDILRQEPNLVVDLQFRERILKSIKESDDPGVLHEERGVSHSRPAWKRVVASFAIAASLAGAMTIGFNAMLAPQRDTKPGLAHQVTLATLAKTNKSFDPGVHIPTQLESYMRMNGYLLSHTAQTGGSSILPYARMVSYTYDQP